MDAILDKAAADYSRGWHLDPAERRQGRYLPERATGIGDRITPIRSVTDRDAEGVPRR
jgi:hypothetical protein